jgi:hypothetical protein
MRTAEEMFPVVEDWLESGLTQKEYSSQHQLAKHILPYWVGRYRTTHPSSAEKNSSFIRLSTPSAPSVDDMEVVLPTGVVIRFSSTIPIAYLAQLLKVCSP